MKAPQTCATLWIVLSLAVWPGCGKSTKEAKAAPSPGGNARSSEYFQTPFQDETQFIVQTIATDLAEQVFYAKYHRLPDAKKFSVQAEEKPFSIANGMVYALSITFGPECPALQFDVK